MIDGRYTIKIDTYDSVVVQYFTPKNTWDFSGSKSFLEPPTALKLSFIDIDSGYTPAERIVYFDNYEGEIRQTDIVQDAPMFGAMHPEQVWKLGKYMHAVTRLRPETYSFSTDIESIMCLRGDRIQLAHDVPLFGLSYGRVLNIIESSGELSGLVLDEIIQFETGKEYGVTVRLQDGTSFTVNVLNSGVDSRTVVFESSIIADVHEDDLVMFGERGIETADLVIAKIEPDSDMGAKLTCYAYDENIYLADEGVVPVYDSKISVGGGGSISVGELPQSNTDKVNEANKVIQITDQIDYRLTGQIPDSTQITTIMGFYPSSFDDYNILYVNYDDGNKLYRKTKAGNEVGIPLNSVSTGRNIKFNNEIFYVNQDDDGRLWRKSSEDTSNGVRIANVPIYDFDIDQEKGDIYYIHGNDQKVYKILYNTISDGTLYFDKEIYDLTIITSNEFYYIGMDNFVYNVMYFDTVFTETLFYDGSVVHEIHSTDSAVYLLNSLDLTIYKKELSSIDTSDKGEPRQGTATGFMVNPLGDIVFSAPYYDSVLFYAPSTTSIQNGSIDAVETAYQFTTDLTHGSDALLNLSIETVDSLVKNDVLIANGLDNDTRVKMVGNNFLYMTKPALTTVTDAIITVSGTRINLNANKVIVPGTISAELLSADAINSKDRDDNGNFITEIDLNSGTQKFRDKDGNIVLDFDPNRVSPEHALKIAGDIQVEGLDGVTITGSDIIGGTISIGSVNGFNVDDNGHVEATSINIQHIYFSDIISKISYYGYSTLRYSDGATSTYGLSANAAQGVIMKEGGSPGGNYTEHNLFIALSSVLPLYHTVLGYVEYTDGVRKLGMFKYQPSYVSWQAHDDTNIKYFRINITLSTYVATWGRV